MAEKNIIRTLEGRVRELMTDHQRLATLCAEMESELAAL